MPPSKTQAAVLESYNQPLQLREFSIPDPEPGAIIVKVDVATICGTDVHIWKGELAPFSRLPLISGHEIVGRVVALGKDRVRDVGGEPLHEGDRICWAYAWCGQCYFCKIARQPTLCPEARMYGWGTCDTHPYLTGGFAEYAYVLPKSDVVKVPDGVPSAVAAAASCSFRTVVHGFERLGGLETAESVVVQGAGPVGLWATVLARTSSAAEVITIGAPAQRLEVARAWGATRTIDIAEVTDPVSRKEMVLGWTGGRGADVVVEAAGASAALVEGFDLVRRGGRYLVIGQANRDKVELPAITFNTKQLSVAGVASGYVPHYYKALRFLDAFKDRYPFERMISNSYPLDRVNDAMASMAALQELKPAIIPG